MGCQPRPSPFRFLLPLRLWLLVLHCPVRASFNHDDVQAQTPTHRATQDYGIGRRLAARKAAGGSSCEEVHRRPFEPLRIGYELLDADKVPNAVKNHVERVVLARAIGFWARALKVRRATAPLKAARSGRGCKKYAMRFGDRLLASDEGFTCEAVEEPQCGAEGQRIPAKYLKSMEVCSERCPPRLESVAHMLHWNRLCDSCQSLPEGPGAEGYDFFVFVTLKDGAFCNDITQAHASSCVKDQCDRSIFALVNFCLSKISTDPADTERQVSVAVHELAHALAFSSHHFQYFRNADGSPKLRREAHDPSMIVGAVPWSCSGSQYLWNQPAGNRHHVDLSQAEIVGSFSERGLDHCPCPVGGPSGASGPQEMSPGCLQELDSGLRAPSCVFKLTTPRVREKAQEFFGCPSLQGAELENQPRSPCTIVSSHWEERVFMGEVMASAQAIHPGFISQVTLAVFEDSGWYMPDYSMADPLVKGVHWGYKQGCSFAMERCIEAGATEHPRFWCTKADETACSLDRMGEVMCTVVAYDSPLPAPTSYFSGLPLGGSIPEADYCPYYHTKIKNHLCTSSLSSSFPYSNANFMREVFGERSRCLESTLHGRVEAADGVFEPDPVDFQAGRPGCFRIDCSPDGSAYEVRISDLRGSTVTLGNCTAAGESLRAVGVSGEVTCAAPAELCGVQNMTHVQDLRAAAAGGTALFDAGSVKEEPLASEGLTSLRCLVGVATAAAAAIGAGALCAGIAAWRRGSVLLDAIPLSEVDPCVE